MLKKFSNFKLFFSIAILAINLNGFGNGDFLKNDLANTKISLITCDPGDEVYSHFGHSAIRIQNINKKIDLVVNWGLFSFSEGQLQFGYDFAKGRLNYFMGFQEMEGFMLEYIESKRSVREQELNLNIEEKKELLSIINENYKPENREYRYEFFYDNCSSRIRDLIYSTLNEKLEWGKSNDANKYSFRKIIHNYLKYDPWLELGIDLVLGKRIDIPVDNKNLMFLPNYMEEIIDKSHIKENKTKRNLVLKKNQIINYKNIHREIPNITIYSWITFIVTLLFLIVKNEKLFTIWSSLNLSIIGVLGILLLFMWFGTDHQATKNNLNVLWASPFHFLLLYFIFSKKWSNISYWYILIALALIFTTILFWFTLTQELNPFVKPIILQTGLIYYYYLRKNKFLINLNSTKD